MSEWRPRSQGQATDAADPGASREQGARISRTSIASEPPLSSPRARVAFASTVPPARTDDRRPSFTDLLAQPTRNRCKGVVFDGLLGFIGERFGDEVLERTRAGLPDPVHEALDAGVILKGGWYPLSWYDALHSSAQAATGRGVELAREIGRETTHRDLASGVYKVFLKILWPDLVIQKAPLIFSRYFEQGTMAVTPNDTEELALSGRRGAVASFTGCEGFTANLWHDCMGGCEGGLIAAGARDVTIEIINGGRSGDSGASGAASYR